RRGVPAGFLQAERAPALGGRRAPARPCGSAMRARPGRGAPPFFEVWGDVAAVRQKAWLFVVRLMASGRDFGWLYPRQDQVCFLDGHVRAFAHLGGVPRRLLYDNLRPAVARVLAGAARRLPARMDALVRHLP